MRYPKEISNYIHIQHLLIFENIFFQGEYPISNGRGGHHEHDEESNDRFSRGRPGDFRPESGNNLFFNIIILALVKLYN